jgi:hypothetical protein
MRSWYDELGSGRGRLLGPPQLGSVGPDASQDHGDLALRVHSRSSGQRPVKKPGDGSNGEARDESGGGEPRKPGKALAPFRFFPERALFISTAVVICCWLSHFFFLLLVDPWRYLAISRESAVAYPSIPLYVGIVFLLFAVYNFIRIRSRSVFHIVLLIFALSFGSLSVQGLIGSVSYLIRRSYGM